MGAGLGVSMQCSLGHSTNSGDDEEVPVLGLGTRSISCTSMIAPRGNVPSVLHVSVPRGPVWASGLYRLVGGHLANNMPLWKAVKSDLWMYSTANGKWGIGGRTELEAGFQTGAAYVFCDSPHGGVMPDMAPQEWFHNKPAWTLDTNISIERWEETIIVVLERQSEIEKHGVQCSILELGEECGAGTSSAHAELAVETPLQPSSVLRIHTISEGSLLAQWNASALADGRRSDVVTVGCEILSVNGEVDFEQMQETLHKQAQVRIEIQRPTGRKPRAATSDENQQRSSTDVEEREEATKPAGAEVGKGVKSKEAEPLAAGRAFEHQIVVSAELHAKEQAADAVKTASRESTSSSPSGEGSSTEDGPSQG
eukprot:CAMPEP_0115305014 /NCGR_PEP_ID=MMETSP0270-20121206/71784_1 /TAXON_ID=71861 /ORGANISM="Scrippsiella trochoidea, Strain CCMP3099" /LENGTH=367 /DNA_ID=CAMNT_0002723167 /DNA_START=1 /DNA_END=1104 /DNA_ORIENTATION=-